MSKMCVIGLLLLVFMASGCETFDIQIETLKVPQGHATTVETTQIPATKSPTPQVITTKTAAPDNKPPTLEVTPDTSLAYCNTGNVFIDDGPQQLPNLDDLYWKVDDSPFGPIHKLMGATTAIYQTKQTPHGDWLMVEFVDVGMDNWTLAALYLLDLQNNDHWVVSSEGRATDVQSYAWMEDGRLLWVDTGKLSIADVDGTNRIDLGAPRSIHEVWLGADNIALAAAEGRLWRVDLLKDIWQEVTGIPPLRNLSIVNNGNAALVVSHDNEEAEYWYVPIAFGSSPRFAVSGEFWGGSGARTPAPRQMGQSHYWTTAYHEQDFLIDDRDRSLVVKEEVFPYIPALEDYVAFSYSADGQWAIADWSWGSTYIAPAQDLQAGRTIPSKILAWQGDPHTVFIWQSNEDGDGTIGNSIQKLNLKNGESSTIITLPQSAHDKHAVIQEDRIFVRYSMYSEESGAWEPHVDSYTITGEQIGSLDFPQTTGDIWLKHIEPSRIALTMTQVNESGSQQCAYMATIWTWDVAP